MAQTEALESKNQCQKGKDGNQKQINDDEDVLNFMDSLDSYLSLLDSLSTTLRQGWFDFSSARYSMGSSRVNSALLDLKEHDAATSLEVRKDKEPHFTLCKWTSSCSRDSGEIKEVNDGSQPEANGMRQRNKDTSQISGEDVKDESSPTAESLATANDRVQKERSKSLAVFGKLVSPKLRTAQFSFETALVTIVEIANARASMLSAFDKVQEQMAGTKG